MHASGNTCLFQFKGFQFFSALLQGGMFLLKGLVLYYAAFAAQVAVSGK